MNENKGKMSTALIVALIAIIILLAVAVVFLVTNQKSTDVAQEGNTTKVEEVADNTDKENNTQNELGETKVVTKDMTADEKYKVYAEGLKNSISKFKGAGMEYDEGPVDIEIRETCPSSSYEYGVNAIRLDYTGTAYLELKSDSILGNKYGETYKIASNIIKIGVNGIGADASELIWAIDESGEIFYVLINYVTDNGTTRGTLEVKKYDDLKNVIDVSNYDNGEIFNQLIATDIEGNIYELKRNLI